MTIDKTYPSSEEELIAYVRKCCDGAKSIAVQAGHFLLYYDHTENLILPAVAEELTEPRLSAVREQIGYFPFATWKLGIKILDILSAQQKQLFCVVNDWQYLPAAEEGVDRNSFFKAHKHLFQSYKEELDRHPDISLLEPPAKPNSNKSVFFSEQTLRNQYERHIKKMRHALKDQQADQEPDDLMQCIQNKEEIWCYQKRPNCVHEVAELLFQLQAIANPDIYIGIYPRSCMAYITQGTILARDLFNVSMSVCNIGLSAVSVNESTILDNAIVEVFNKGE